MNRLIWLLVILLISDILFDWYANNQKLEALVEIKVAGEKVHADIDSINATLEQIRIEMKDDEAWLNAEESLRSNSTR